jgi:hypothetical protein
MRGDCPVRVEELMPLTPKGEKILENMEQEYGEKKGEQVFYASANKGTITGVHGASRHLNEHQFGKRK